MKNRTAWRARSAAGLAVVAIASTLALTACSSDGGSSSAAGSTTSPTTASTGAATAAATASPADTAALAKVTVTGAAGKKPTVKLPTTPFTVSAAVARVVTPGTGAAIKEGQQLTIREVALQGTDGKVLGDSFSGAGETVVYTAASLPPALAGVFNGAKVGTRLLFANPSTDSSGAATTEVYAMDISGAKALPSRASGTAVTPKSGLPTVKLASNGAPSITIAKGYKAPKTLVTQTLIKGDGKKVTATDSVTAQYTGWTLDGKKFDSSWDRGESANFSLSGVIPGWTKGLTGQTVGSQVLLVIPAADGYGATPPEGSGIAKNATLVFVVDILDVQPGASGS